MQNWYSIEWFSYNKLTELNWGRPYFLYFLFLIPFLFVIKSLIKNQKKQSLPIATIKGQIKSSWSSNLRFIPPVLQLLSLSLFVIALARPQISNTSQNRFSEGIDIILALDISESMLIKDMAINRLEASKEIAKKFINNRYQDRIGIVVFSGEAFSLSPLTIDYKALIDYISDISPSLISADGTAIGSALAVSVNRLLNAKSKSKIIILISDGDNTAGNIDPTTAAKIAKAYGVKIYSILVGGKPVTSANDTFSTSYIKSFDQQVLSEIATIADGKFFKATSLNGLKNVFEQINKIEKVKYLENSLVEQIDVFSVYLRWGIVFYLFAFFTKITFLTNILED